MKLNNVCSFALAQRLKKIGIKQDSFFFYERIKYCGGGFSKPTLDSSHFFDATGGEYCSAFTTSELGDLLPHWLVSYRLGYYYYMIKIEEKGKYSLIEETKSKKEVDARAKMIIKLKTVL